MTSLNTVNGRKTWEIKVKPLKPNYVEAPDFVVVDVSSRGSVKTDTLAFHILLLVLALAVLLSV